MSDVTTKGLGTTIKVWNETLEVPVWATIAQVYNITGGELTREDGEDADTFLDSDSPGGDFRKRAAGTKTIGDLELDLAWEVTQTSTKGHKLLHDLYASGAERYFKIKYPNDAETGEIYHAFVQSIGEKNVEPDSTIRLPVTLRPTGKYHHLSNDIDDVELPGFEEEEP